MDVHVFQHVPFEGLGSIGAWLEDRDRSVSYTRFFANDPLPPIEDIKLLIAMGGPMSVNDELTLPWLKDEKQFVREAIFGDVPVLGICFGAQLVASALGAAVYRNPTKEIGWFPIQSVSTSETAFHFPSECLAFHWHGEIFDLPPGAVQLARSKVCENQAFQFKHNVIGLQCHLETTPEGMAALINNCGRELVTGEYVQTEESLRATPLSRYDGINNLMEDVLSYLIES
jgi:GMP synthase-like glutamine amidotransferase